EEKSVNHTRHMHSTEEQHAADDGKDGHENSGVRQGTIMTRSHLDQSGLALQSTDEAWEAARIFEKHRPRLFRIACRMLPSRADADDVMQEACLRWHQSATGSIQSPLGFLITVTTRLCVNQLRERKHERERYIEPESPEHIAEDHAASPEAQLELADEVSVG